MEDLKSTLTEVDYADLDAPEDHLKINVNNAWKKLQEYYARLDDTPIYYAATRLHPFYKNHLDILWKVPESHCEYRDGPHPREGWLENNQKALLGLWQSYKEKAAVGNGKDGQGIVPQKRQHAGSSSRSDFLRAQIKAAIDEDNEVQANEYERWRREPPLEEKDGLADDPIRYWFLQRQRYPLLAQLALDIFSIPASSADCERTFSELGDLLGVKRLRMKADLLSALQSLRSWKRLGLKPSQKGK